MNIMKKIYDILYEICGDNRVYNPDCELVESGLLDSYAVIELFSRLEDEGIEINPARVDRSLLKTPAGIAKLVEEYESGGLQNE